MNFSQVGLKDADCIENKVRYLRLAINTLERYYNIDLCDDMTLRLLNKIIEKIGSICISCRFCYPLLRKDKADYLLQESGSYLLQQNNYKIII